MAMVNFFERLDVACARHNFSLTYVITASLRRYTYRSWVLFIPAKGLMNIRNTRASLKSPEANRDGKLACSFLNVAGATLSMERNQRAEERFLDQHVFYDLLNLNDGFDAPGIKYFSKDDFAKVLDRLEVFGIGVLGIEPWPNGEFGDVSTFEEYGDDPADPKWYRKAYGDFLERGIESHFSATYAIPEEILKRFVAS